MAEEKWPSKIEIDRDKKTIIVDGEPFPFAISPDLLQCGYDSQGAPVVKLQIMADQITEKSGITKTTYSLEGALPQD